MSDAGVYPEVSAVVVLGAGWEPDLEAPTSVQLNTSSAVRPHEGLRLIEALPEVRVLVSGASRGEGQGSDPGFSFQSGSDPDSKPPPL